MRNILNINSDWILSTEKTPDGKAVHKRILPLNKEDAYCYYLELLGAAPSMEVFVNQEKIGETLQVLVEEKDEDGSYIGRTEYDAPEIDDSVIFTSKRDLKPGNMVYVQIRDAFDYDLVGEEV